MATKKELKLQQLPTGVQRQDEKLIHNIFFPTGKDSLSTNDHDIWLLNEEYHYYEYIASNKQLSKIEWSDGSLLFQNDVDNELASILKSRSTDNARKRPDIALFNQEGSAIIIEFKSPGVNMDEFTGDLIEYSQLLAAKSNGRIKKFYGYLIGTDANPLRIGAPYTRFPSNKGWFGTQPLMDPASGIRLGELYSEILYYDDIADRASKRIQIYKDRLGLKEL